MGHRCRHTSVSRHLSSWSGLFGWNAAIGSWIWRVGANPGLDTTTQDGKRVRIEFGEDPGQAGKSRALHLGLGTCGTPLRARWANSCLDDFG
jgi:hypothetical protein